MACLRRCLAVYIATLACIVAFCCACAPCNFAYAGEPTQSFPVLSDETAYDNVSNTKIIDSVSSDVSSTNLVQSDDNSQGNSQLDNGVLAQQGAVSGSIDCESTITTEQQIIEDIKDQADNQSDIKVSLLSDDKLTVQAASIPKASVNYEVHVQGISWQKAVKDGETAGTVGKALRVEAIKFTITGDVKGAVQAQAHVEKIGWQGLTSNPGTTGQALRVEAIRLMLIGDVSQWYDITYRVHVQNKGWMDWVSNGEIAGTTGQALRIEAIEAKLKAKSVKTATSDGIIGVRTTTHVQNIGWQSTVMTGATAGTTGKALQVEALQIALDAGTIGGGIQYKAHVQNSGWQNWVANGGTAGTTGRSLQIEAFQIHLTGAIADVYDVVYRAHVQSVGWQPWTLNDGIAGTTGKALQVEALQIKLIKKNSLQSIAEGAYFVASVQTSQEVLNVTNNSEAANTRMQVNAYSTSTFSNRFYVRKSDGAITLQAATSGLFLTDSGNSTIVQIAQNNLDSQRWLFTWDGGYQLKNVATGKVMALASNAANGVWVNTAVENAKSKLQRWTFTDTGIMPDGAYIFTNTNSGRVLDVDGANRRDGANAIIHDSNGGNNQKFTVMYLGGNRYSIRNTVTLRAVQVSGSNIQMQGWNGSNIQKWKTDLVAAKTFRFINVSTGTAMDVSGGAKTNGANVVVASGVSNSQRFKLTATTRKAEIVSIGVPVIFQNPELPTGCESVALTEALNYYGFGLGKTVIADNYMPWSGDDFVYAFMGNPHSDYGAAIMAPGIANTANSFLVSRGSTLRASNITGTAFGDLYTYLDQGIPVVVWNTMYMSEPGYVSASRDGYNMRGNTHAVTLSGYNPFDNTVLVADPLSGGVWRDRGRFEYLYNEMGRQAVIIK